jgi:hypothetical protein
MGFFTGAATASWNRVLVVWKDLDRKGVGARRVREADESRGTRRRDAIAARVVGCGGKLLDGRDYREKLANPRRMLLFQFTRVGRGS